MVTGSPFWFWKVLWTKVYKCGRPLHVPRKELGSLSGPQLTEIILKGNFLQATN